jgi:uracil-DNA glycosylase
MDLTTLGPWRDLLADTLSAPYFAQLSDRVDAAYASATVYPPKEDLFAAFALTPPEAVRVVILGQDPYHEPGQAHGLSFSVRPGVALPPSLRNIYKELESDLGIAPADSGCLEPWARQGVLLLNTVLTVEQGKANSHKDFGWQTFTDAVMAALAGLPQPLAAVLWGGQARKKAAVIKNSVYPRLVVESAHPSPLSSYRGFFGSRPFSRINAFLTENGEEPIRWEV